MQNTNKTHSDDSHLSAVTDSQRMPEHIAIIMDGNGRWAKARNLPHIAGHKKGMGVVKEIVNRCGELGVKYLTLYAFSSENWNRPKEEVIGLMGLLRHYMVKELGTLHKKGARVKFIGRLDSLDKDIIKMLKDAEELTKDNDKITVVVALSYGSRDEIVDTIQSISKEVKAGNVKVNEIDENLITNSLYTKDIPDPDLVIRTSGEERLSNFLLWQSAYSEFVFVEQLWPDFNEQSLVAAIETYAKRERRFGARL